MADQSLFAPFSKQALQIKNIAGAVLILFTALFSCNSCESTDPESSMVRIPGGTFQMGNDDVYNGQPVHSVTVKPFLMSKTEVTLAEFKAFVEDTGYKTDAEKSDSIGTWTYVNKQWKFAKGGSWRLDIQGKKRSDSESNHPVYHVSWRDAVAYCDWLTKKTKANPRYRLPSEAEWEFAAGNGEKHTLFSWGGDIPNGSDKKTGGNVADETFKPSAPDGWKFFDGYNDGYIYDAPVGQFAPNEFGLFDMTGNVWEWCQDCYSVSYENAPKDSQPWMSGDCNNRVLRGGAWYNGPDFGRTMNRYNLVFTYRIANLGFRVARDAGGQ